MTKLEKNLRRELTIDGEPYTLNLDATGFTLAQKGRRKGLTLEWKALVSGDAALATALQAAVAQMPSRRD
jgi:hypothetical protein